METRSPTLSRRAVLAAAGAWAGAMLIGGNRASGGPETPAAGIISIQASERELRFRLRGDHRRVRLLEFPLYADAGNPALGSILWEGNAADAEHAPIKVDRSAGAADRLFRKFQLIDASTGEFLGPQRFINDLSRLALRPDPLPWPASIKGVSCPVDVQDFAQLGVRHTHLNVNAAGLIAVAPDQREDDFSHVVDGQRIYLHPARIRAIDQTTRQLTAIGVNVICVLLNDVTSPGPLTHPRTDPHAAPNKLGAFNLADAQGLLHYRAVVEFLADRYTRADMAYGTIGGWIIGNEVNDHWIWHHMGPASLQAVARQVADELRIAHYAIRSRGSAAPVFGSFDHFWASSLTADRRQSLPTRDLLEAINDLTKREGDFAWNVAHHPYPESLFDPRFWNDRSAVFSFDTPRVTFKNVEVIADYLRQPAMHCDGKPRRLILSEQGLHAGATPESERVQAAAFALAWHRLSQIPAVEAFILHRQVDHPGEGGLKLGLWTWTPSAPTGRKRPIWDVLRAADTSDWPATSAFALPILGMQDWPRKREPVSPDTRA